MVRPIPKKFLIHEVIYEEFVEGDGFETEDGFKVPVTLSNVILQFDLTISRSSIAEKLNYNALLYFDVVNSVSSGLFEFKEKSRITYEGKQMIVQKVHPVYAFTLHHYEIGLV